MSKNLQLLKPINVVLFNVNIYTLTEVDDSNRKNIYNHNDNKYIMEEDDVDSRPDILFFSLLALQDSIINTKKLLNIYIITNNNILIKVYNIFRVPRTYNLFLKVIKMLFNSEDKILKASNSDDILLEILPNPISHYIANGITINISNHGYLVDLRKFLSSKSDSINNEPFTFYINGSESDDRFEHSEYSDNTTMNELSVIENEILNSINNPKIKCSNTFDISISKINLTCSAKCYKLLCDLEHVFNL